ncbi:MAG: hypothetical protein JXR83_08545, partial [Deltaproteobacteria bacterium]|nr:hypothetical protein [Deltaproteobacteria bacterium]
MRIAIDAMGGDHGLAEVVRAAAVISRTEQSPSLLLDVGATLDADARDLEAFAVMGNAYASRIGRTTSPRVALLTAVDPAWRGAGGRLFSPRSDDKKTSA